jgi:hypothetical protein
MSCPNKERCPLYPHFQMESSLDFWKLRYCNTDSKYESCKRWEMANAGTMPDPLMLPNGEHLEVLPSDDAKASSRS